jgi:hypothetical protein
MLKVKSYNFKKNIKKVNLVINVEKPKEEEQKNNKKINLKLIK